MGDGRSNPCLLISSITSAANAPTENYMLSKPKFIRTVLGEKNSKPGFHKIARITENNSVVIAMTTTVTQSKQSINNNN